MTDVQPSKHRILVLGGGFAGLWSAVGAARRLDELGVPASEVRVTLVNRDAWHCIRVRNYEADLGDARLPLDRVLGPIGVERVEGEVRGIDAATRSVHVEGRAGVDTLHYDRLVFALGSELLRPQLPGLVAHAFDIDTFDAASRLAQHLQALPEHPAASGRYTVVVVGAGLSGIEAAAEMPGRLRAIVAAAGRPAPWRVVLVEHGAQVGATLGDGARRLIEQALGELGVEVRTGVRVTAIDREGITLAGGETIATATVVWCAGMRAPPLTAALGVPLDRAGRLPVDAQLKVRGLEGVFAAGDSAACRIDGANDSMMSCQHSRPMGRFAGHNAVADLLGLPLLPLHIGWYVTVLDLGDWGAVYTQGWDRVVVASGAQAKRTKETINRRRIYPPLSGDRRAILDAAAPVVDAAPARPG